MTDSKPYFSKEDKRLLAKLPQPPDFPCSSDEFTGWINAVWAADHYGLSSDQVYRWVNLQIHLRHHG